MFQSSFKKVGCYFTLTFSCFLLITISSSIRGQEPTYIFTHITVEDGLPHYIPIKTLQDREGYLWISSNAGLIKYDGFEFKHLTHSENNSASLSGNNIQSTFLDNSDNLWIGTSQNGLNLLDSEQDLILRLDGSSSLPVINSKRIYFICQDWKNRIWIGGNRGLEVLEENENGYSKVDLPILSDSISNKVFYSAILDQNDVLWLGGKGSVLEIDHENIRQYDFGREYGPVNDFGIDRNGQLWMSLDGKSQRVFTFERLKKVFTPQTFIVQNSTSRNIMLEFDKDNNLWLSEFGFGFQMYNISERKVVINSLVNTNLDPELFAKDPFCDKSGNVWIGAYGLYKYPYNQGFHTFYHQQKESQVINAIYSDGNNLWINARSGGLILHNLESNEEIIFKADYKNSNSLHDNHVADIYRINEDEVLLTMIGAIQILNTKTFQFKTFKNNGENRSIFVDSEDHIWICANYGMYLFDPVEGIIDTIKLPGSRPRQTLRTMVACEDMDKRIWFADRRLGLGLYDLKTQEISHAPLKNPLISKSTFENEIEDMVYDGKRNLIWIASYRGLVKVNLETGNFDIVSDNIGLGSMHFYSLIVKDDVVWAGTIRGIIKYDIERKVFTHYEKNHGLINTHMYSQCVSLLDNGTIMFGGQNGIDYFKPQDIRVNAAPILPFCTSLSVNGVSRPVPKRDQLLEGLEFKAKEKFVELTFSSDNMSNPQSNHFYYKIVGIHNDWILLGSNPHISLGNLKGKNKLLLKVISPNSAGQEYVFEVPIIFRKYLYETNWFRILAILFVLGIVFSLVRWAEQKKIRATVERARIKDQMATLEKKALASQMNPHFIFNSINAIQEFIYNNDDEAAINYLSKFSKIIRAVLNFSSQERIPLSEEIEFLEHYLDMQKMRFSSNFLYQFIIPERLDVHSIEIPPFMIQPHIENSIEHGLLAKKDGGEIIIELKDVDGYLHVSIDDNGIGIIAARAKKDKSKISRKSKGIALVQQRMNHMKIDHKDVDMKIIDKKETANEAGTRVELIIPYD